ncbi:hypothetical protein RN001_008370 [Aquatica leii]|uniref:Uncharacterized protein n=1 Tax=Aquatica leii TaxID=1421715 RepID=A0AAN7PA89_9COLE|nr:hypothetical protein RN001_008370 [Aquatica leii]
MTHQIVKNKIVSFCSQLRTKREAVNTKNCTFIDDRRHEHLLKEINIAKTAKKKSPRDYWLLKRYDSITIGQKYKLTFPVKAPNNNIMYHVVDSELFEVLHDTHQIVCPLCAKNALSVENRISSKKNLTEQAQKMLRTSVKKIPPVPLGTTVRIPIPEVDRGRGDARNILAVVLQKTDDELYELGTKQGVIKTLYSRHQFTACHHKLPKKEHVSNQETTLRTVANLQSTRTGQGFVKCTCKKHCDTKKCSCLKRKILCSSKCHNSSSCKNK